MSLLDPRNLLWILPLGGAIILLYMLRMRRQDLKVPAAFLWPKQVEEVRANSLIQRLKFSWLMVLQLLALAALIFVLARPQQREEGLAGEVTVFVLDGSASMAATDVSPNRFGVARGQIQAAIQSAKPGDRIALIFAGAETKVVFSLGRDAANQLRLLNSLRPSDAQGNVLEALRLATALVGSQDSGRIVLVSDGAFPDLKDFSPGKAQFLFRGVGEKADNLALTALGVGNTGDEPQVFVGIKNEGDSEIPATLNLFADGKLISSENIAVAGTRNWGKNYRVPAGTSVLQAKLDAKDFLASDNQRTALVDPRQNLKVLLVSPGNIFLERAIALDPRVTLDRADKVPETELSGPGASQYSIVVFDGVPEVAVKAKAILNFASAGPSSLVQVKGDTQTPSFVSQEDVPLLSGVNLAAVTVQTGQDLTAKPAGRVVARTSNGPLIVVGDGAKRSIYVGFAPFSSDFPLDASFPIFISNSLDFLAGAIESDAIVVAPGRPLSFPSDTPLTLLGPGATRTTLESRNGVVGFPGFDQVGEFRLEGGSRPQTIYVSADPGQESTIRPNKEIQLGGGTVAAVQAPARFTDFWRPLIFLALLILGVEWWLFARKS